MTLTLHKDAGQVIKLMRTLGMDEAMQGRVIEQLWVEKSYSDIPLEQQGYRKMSMEALWVA